MRRGSDALRRAWKIARTQGLRAFWFRLLAAGVYRRMIVTELPLHGSPAAPAPHDLEARFLRPEDAEAYRALRGDHAAERLARGERCFGIWLDGRLVSTRWLATGTAYVDYLDRRCRLAPGTVYMHDVYVAPEMRGRNVGLASVAALPPLLAAEGAQRIVGVLDPENPAAVAYNRRYQAFGYRDAGRIGWIGLGRLRRHFGTL